MKISDRRLRISDSLKISEFSYSYQLLCGRVNLTAHKLKAEAFVRSDEMAIQNWSQQDEWWNLFREGLLTNVERKEADESETEENQRQIGTFSPKVGTTFLLH